MLLRSRAMHRVKAVVRNGRLIVDEPTTLREGTEVKLEQRRYRRRAR